MILFSVAALAQPAFEKALYVTATGDTLPYRILYPENYKPGKKYPLVLFLHGAGERGNDNELQLKHGSRMFLDAKNRKKYPAIVIFPQCPAENYWASVNVDRNQKPINFVFDYNNPPHWPLTASVDLVKKFIDEGKADPDRIIVMGLSMGGMGTFEAISRNPGLFSAAVPICGGGDTTFCSRYAGRLPLWVFHGSEDNVVLPAYSRAMVAQLKSLHATVRYTEYEGVGHDSWEKAFAEPKLLAWMFSQKQKRKKK